ncbi:hypothetical protein VTO73DRAFT_3349 [Trametes versicolor]
MSKRIWIQGEEGPATTVAAATQAAASAITARGQVGVAWERREEKRGNSYAEKTRTEKLRNDGVGAAPSQGYNVYVLEQAQIHMHNKRTGNWGVPTRSFGDGQKCR